MSQSAQELHEALNLAGDAVKRDANGAVHLIGTECNACGKRVFPPTDVCPECMSENVAPLTLATRGTLYSWSVVHAAPRGWSLPFVAAYVQFSEQAKLLQFDLYLQRNWISQAETLIAEITRRSPQSTAARTRAC